MVPAACSLTAARSLTKAFSPALGAGELMKRRWTAGERRKRGAERMICRCGNIFGGFSMVVWEWRGSIVCGSGYLAGGEEGFGAVEV